MTTSTTREDAFGYDLTLAEPAALGPWSDTVRGFLSHAAATPKHLAATLEAAPNFALAHAAKGYFMLIAGRRELLSSAEDSYRAAVAAADAGGATPRERAYIEGLRLYLDGSIAGSADRLDRALTRYPADALLLKLVHAIRFIVGDAAGMRRSIESVLSVYDANHPAIGYVNGCYAFALEETGEYMAAEVRGRDSLVAADDDAWGLHAVAHVYDMTNRANEGVAWIARQEAAWSHCSNFAYHVWWHLALFHLDRGEHRRVFELYDEQIRKDKTDEYRDISNAASLLTRLELDGLDVGDRWEELAALSEGRAEDGCVVFADLHYLLALAGDGRDDAAERLLSTMRANAERRIGCMDRISGEAGVPAGRGLMAFARGDYPKAYASLAAARAQMQTVGGSHAQRDVFERVTIEAALRAGLLDDAQSLVQDRMRRRGAFDRYGEARLARINALRREVTVGAAS